MSSEPKTPGEAAYYGYNKRCSEATNTLCTLTEFWDVFEDKVRDDWEAAAAAAIAQHEAHPAAGLPKKEMRNRCDRVGAGPISRIELTLSDAAHAALAALGSAAGCSRSEVVEALLRADPADRLRARVERWQRRIEKGDGER